MISEFCQSFNDIGNKVKVKTKFISYNNNNNNNNKDNDNYYYSNNFIFFQIYFSNTQFLGEYTCTARNEYGNNSTTFILEEGVEPKKPNVVLDQTSDKSYKFKIYQTPPMQNLTNFVIQYKKSNDNTSYWQSQNFPPSKYRIILIS